MRVSRIETARFLAVLMLVTYHVIGAGSDGGLKLPDDHWIRVASDVIADLRMPLFAAISGYVYALKPPTLQTFGAFIRGKMRRLAVPGAIAITVFLLLSETLQTRFALGADWWKAYIFSYAHYWFLQAILLLFLTYCAFDSVTSGRYAVHALVFAVFVYVQVPYIDIEPMSFNRAIYLLPYFIVGTLLSRERRRIERHRGPFLAVALLVTVSASVWSFLPFQDTQDILQNRRDLQSLLLGTAAASLCLYGLPATRALANFGPLSFTIYLYHVIGTSSMRRLLDVAGVESLAVHVGLGVLAGFALPWAIHCAAKQHRSTAQLILGQSQRRYAT